MTAPAPAARVYTVATAPALTGPWTALQSARPGPIRRGHGAVAGSTSVQVLYGDDLVRDGQAPANVPAPSTGLLGQLLRVTHMDGETMRTDFIGRIESMDPTAATASMTIQAEGIIGSLARVHCLRCTEMPPLGDAPAWTESDERSAWGAPPFAVGTEGGQADASDMPPGRAPAFDRSPSGGRWSAYAASRYLLERIAPDPLLDAANGSLQWQLDEGAAIDLNYTLPRLETQGRRVLDILLDIWTQERDLSLRVSGVDYGTGTIAIQPISLSGGIIDINLDAGPYTQRSVSLRRSVPAVAVTGGASRQLLSLTWQPEDEDSSITPEWSPGPNDAAALLGAWDGSLANETPTWRVWSIAPTWTGATAPQINATAPPDGLQHISNADGGRMFGTQAGAPLVAIYAARMRRGSMPEGDILPEPIAMAIDNSGECIDLTPYGITCDDETSTIAIGSTIDDALMIRDHLRGRRLVVTLAMDDPEPLAAYAAAAWPGGIPETVQETHPDLIRLRAAAGAALGIDPASRQVQSSNAESIIRNDQGQLLQLRDRLANRYARLSGRATFTQLGHGVEWIPGDTFGGLRLRGQDYAFPLVVATVTTDPQAQTVRVELVPITAHKART